MEEFLQGFQTQIKSTRKVGSSESLQMGTLHLNIEFYSSLTIGFLV